MLPGNWNTGTVEFSGPDSRSLLNPNSDQILTCFCQNTRVAERRLFSKNLNHRPYLFRLAGGDFFFNPDQI